MTTVAAIILLCVVGVVNGVAHLCATIIELWASVRWTKRPPGILIFTQFMRHLHRSVIRAPSAVGNIASLLLVLFLLLDVFSLLSCCLLSGLFSDYSFFLLFLF